MLVERTSEFDRAAPAVAVLLFDPRVMVFLLRPLVTVMPLAPPNLPARWEAGRYRVVMGLFGLVPLGWQDIVLGDIVEDAAAGRWGFRDDGRGRFLRRWDHRARLDALPDGRSRYCDSIEIEAAWMTPLAGLFAWTVLAWRHRRWRRLLATPGHCSPSAQGSK